MWEKIIEFIKLSPKYLFGVSVVSGILLFANNRVINILGIGGFLKDYREYIGVVFLISLIFTINGFNNIKKRYSIFKDKKIRIEKLNNLTTEEKNMLNEYISNQTKTRKFLIQSGITKEMEYYEILYKSSDIGDLRYGFSYNIQPWAWDYLNKHKDILLNKK